MDNFRNSCYAVNGALIFSGAFGSIVMFPFFLLALNGPPDWCIPFTIAFLLSFLVLVLGVWGRDYKEELARRQARLEAVAREALDGMLTGLQCQATTVFITAVELSDSVPKSPDWYKLAEEYRDGYKDFWRQVDDLTEEGGYDFLRHFKPIRYRMDDQLELIGRIESCAPDDPRLPVLCARLRKLSAPSENE